MDSFIENLKKREIPSLYGLRGVAALTVVLFHTLASMHLYDRQRWLPGDEAVALFFELSGLLITWLLLRENHRTGSIHLKKFYFRRALRLFPAFYVLWLLCTLIPSVQARWWSFFYARDLWVMFPPYASGTPVFAMAWSLGVEEKFYLLWPWTLRKMHSKNLPAILIGLALLSQLYRLGVAFAGNPWWAGYGFATHLDGLMLGAALALAVHRGWRPMHWMLHPATLIASLVIIEGMPLLVKWPGTVCWGVSICAFPLLLVLIYVVSKPPTLLNNPIAKFFGNISYSLYLYHLLVIYLLRNVTFSHWRYQIGATLGLSIAAATVSYFGVELPFLKLKNRLHPVPVAQSVSKAMLV